MAARFGGVPAMSPGRDPARRSGAANGRRWRGTATAAPGAAGIRGGRRTGRTSPLTGRTRSRTRLVVWAWVILAAAGCEPASPTGPAPHASGVSLHASSTELTGDARAAVQDATSTYRAMWVTYQWAARTPDPLDPNLSRYAAGDALHTLTDALRLLQREGPGRTGSVELHPSATFAAPPDDPTRVEISDCIDTTDSHLGPAIPGSGYSPAPGGRRRCLATVHRQADGMWRVTRIDTQEVGTC